VSLILYCFMLTVMLAAEMALRVSHPMPWSARTGSVESESDLFYGCQRLMKMTLTLLTMCQRPLRSSIVLYEGAYILAVDVGQVIGERGQAPTEWSCGVDEGTCERLRSASCAMWGQKVLGNAGVDSASRQPIINGTRWR